MIAFCRSLYSGRRVALLAMFAFLLTAAWTVSARAGARANLASTPATPPATPPYALFQNSTLTSSGNTIIANNLPVVTTGGIIYDNVTIQFDVAADGTLTVSSGYPQITLAPSVQSTAFQAGNYGLANDGGTQVVVSGPGITNGGSTEWSLQQNPGASCPNPPSAAWYVGPIKNSPYYIRIKAAGVPLTGFSYGISGSTCGGATWGANSLLGFSQTGSQMSIVSFTFNGVDQSQQVAQVSYSKQ